jgi:hypothetical protein
LPPCRDAADHALCVIANLAVVLWVSDACLRAVTSRVVRMLTMAARRAAKLEHLMSV